MLLFISYRYLLLMLLVCTLGGSRAILAQTLTCGDTIVPLSAIRADGEIVRDLTADDLVAGRGPLNTLRTKQTISFWEGHQIPVLSLTANQGGRRIIFILDGSPELPSDFRATEGKIVAHVLASARPQDSFALITVHGVLRQVRFNQGRDAIQQAANDLASEVPENAEKMPTMEGIEKAIQWFGQARSDDGILLIAHELKEPEKSTYFHLIFKLLYGHYIRIFAVSLGKVDLRIDYAKGLQTPANQDYMYSLALISGGSIALDDASALPKDFKVTDEHLEKLQAQAMQFYKLMTQSYELKLRATEEIVPRSTKGYPLYIQLSETGKARFPNAKLLYPYLVRPPCKYAEANPPATK
jgi:hypothetical protein